MTFDDLAGQEFEHPAHGLLTIIEHNHAGQVFCYDDKGRYFIVEGDDPALDELTDEPLPDELIEFIDFSEEATTNPKRKCLIVTVDDLNQIVAKFKNLQTDEAKEIIRTLDDIFSDPFEGRYNVN
jgi:hypothetical protein